MANKGLYHDKKSAPNVLAASFYNIPENSYCVGRCPCHGDRLDSHGHTFDFVKLHRILSTPAFVAPILPHDAIGEFFFGRHGVPINITVEARVRYDSMPVDVRAYCAMSVDVSFPPTRLFEPKNRAWVEEFKERLRNEIQKIAAADEEPAITKSQRCADGKETFLETDNRKADGMTGADENGPGITTGLATNSYANARDTIDMPKVDASWSTDFEEIVLPEQRQEQEWEAINLEEVRGISIPQSAKRKSWGSWIRGKKT
ncbi:MAG: hypothetical protein Q9191_007102 [Dirinaria sp. TL-2023a]